MCIDVIADGRDIGVARDLAEWIGIHPTQLILADPHDTIVGFEHCCLCQVDIRKTLDQNGIWSRRADDGNVYAMKKS
jgi:hypothetical protein